MENQTRFDLNAAMEDWRKELATLPNLSTDNRRELETHLRDTMGELRRCGLNEEESFWLSCRRVGQPQKLAEEFAKADPVGIWRERLFWMLVALLALNLWAGVNYALMPWYTPHTVRIASAEDLGSYFPGWMIAYFPAWLKALIVSIMASLQLPSILNPLINILPFGLFAFFLLRGRMAKGCTLKCLENFLFISRLRFLVLATASVLLVNFLHYAIQMLETRRYAALMGAHVTPGFGQIMFSTFIIENSFWPLMLILLIICLLPTQTRKTPKGA